MKRIALPTCLLLVVMLASFAVLRARAQDEPTQPIPADNQPIPILSDALQSPDPDVLAPVSQTDPLLIDPQPLDQPRLNALPVPGLPAAVLAPLPEDEPVPIGAPILAPPGALVLPGALAPPVLQSADLVPSQILPPGPSAPTVATDPFAAPAHDDRRLPFVQIYQLKYMPAQDAAGTLQQLFPDRDLNFVADERTNSIVVRGHEDDFKQISELLKELDSADAVVPKKTLIKRNRSDDERLLERRVLELKSKLDEETARSTGRKTKDTDTRLQELAQQLRGAVDEAFNERQRQQLAEIEELTVRLSKLAKVVREREAQREAIIEERLSQLTGGKQSDLRKEPVVRSEGASEEGLFVDDFPGVSLLLFTAANSPPSREMERNLASLQKDGIHVETIDVSVTPEIGLRFGVESIPTVILKNHGQVVKKIVGTTTE